MNQPTYFPPVVSGDQIESAFVRHGRITFPRLPLLPPEPLPAILRLMLAIARAEAEGYPALAAAFAEILKRQMEARRG